MSPASSRSDREARIKATASFLHSPGALRAAGEADPDSAGGPLARITSAADGPVLEVWWWAGRVVAAVAFVAALVAPWVLLLAEWVLDRELPG